MHKFLTRRLFALLKLEKDIGVRKKVETAGTERNLNTGSKNKDPHAWSREKQQYTEKEGN